jgi:hypothetical protein
MEIIICYNYVVSFFFESFVFFQIINVPTIPQFQKNWDNINIKRIIANDLIFNSPRDLARFKALQCRESGS